MTRVCLCLSRTPYHGLQTSSVLLPPKSHAPHVAHPLQVVANFGGFFPELVRQRDVIYSVLREEEAAFSRTLVKGEGRGGYCSWGLGVGVGWGWSRVRAPGARGAIWRRGRDGSPWKRIRYGQGLVACGDRLRRAGGLLGWGHPSLCAVVL